jgi:tRNA (guanine37-N1)-methyltransferase
MPEPAVHFELVTLFPELFDSYLAASLLGKAIGAGLVAVSRTNPRDFGLGRHHSVDDSPYGGGPGMVMRPEPLAAAIEHVEQARGPARRLLLSPQGRLFDQQMAAALAREPRVMLICGRYEGIDERLAAACAHDVVSIGDYVLSGGELAAAVVIDAVTRLLPGVLGDESSHVEDSFTAGLVDCPQYTRPELADDRRVPDVLLGGDHAAVRRWRLKQALGRTWLKRPALLAQRQLSEEEQQLLAEFTAEWHGLNSRP